MQRQPSSARTRSPTRRPPRALRARLCAALSLALAALASCSVLVERRDRQCATDADCARFPGARCDPGGRVCVPADGVPPAGCDGDDGCYSCAPTTNEQLLNACTDAACRPFDDARLTNLRDGGLPPLPEPGASGGR
ncbi:hypothetical protein [Sorangium cellulosum]|uniref:Secreted protein n=1 Tax=Sorangium cellulosum So0157-2 TaxID=1254432 RepID=S4XLV1_SORCE|nr:hypothetical protein [Sorangium cellulosum]AGP33514.1 hypothetical protein SCE1572_02730 [Sorangium cellulosum So0157-2]